MIGETKEELGGDIGATIDIAGLNPELRGDYKLFSESNTRWVVEVWRGDSAKFEALMSGQPVTKIGDTEPDKRVIVNDVDRELVNLSLDAVRDAWRGQIR